MYRGSIYGVSEPYVIRGKGLDTVWERESLSVAIITAQNIAKVYKTPAVVFLSETGWVEHVEMPGGEND